MSSDLINIFKTAKNLQETDKKAAENKYSDFVLVKDFIRIVCTVIKWNLPFS
jgi:hypothetical protein